MNSNGLIEKNGHRIHVRLLLPETDPFKLLIVLHGLTGDMEEEHIQMAGRCALEAGYGVLWAELYGHGQSGGSFHDHDLIKWIDDLMTVIGFAKTIKGADGLVLAGHSQGGLLAILAGGMYADVFDALVLLSPAVSICEQAKEGMFFGKTIMEGGILPEEIVFKERVLSANYLRAASLFDPEAMMMRFDKPVLIVHGNVDKTVPIRYSIEADRIYKDSTLAIIDGADHCYHGQLGELKEILIPFLKENR